jgi:hypothetical protein
MGVLSSDATWTAGCRSAVHGLAKTGRPVIVDVDDPAGPAGWVIHVTEPRYLNPPGRSAAHGIGKLVLCREPFRLVMVVDRICPSVDPPQVIAEEPNPRARAEMHPALWMTASILRLERIMPSVSRIRRNVPPRRRQPPRHNQIRRSTAEDFPLSEASCSSSGRLQDFLHQD